MNLLTTLDRSARTAAVTLAAAVLAVGIVLALPKDAALVPDVSSGLPASYQSAAAELRQATLPSPDVVPAVVVISRTDGAALTGQDRSSVDAAAARLAPLAATGGSSSGTSAPPVAPQYSTDSTVAVVPVPVDTSVSDLEIGEQVAGIRQAAADGLPAGLASQVTGGPAVTADLGKVFDGADVTLLLATVLVVAVLLIVTYRSPWFWLVPLLVVAFAEQVALKLVGLLAPVFDIAVDDAATGITSVLVFGAATDYALLLISRYRANLREEDNRYVAMQRAVRGTVEPVLASSATVVLSLLTLLLAQQESLRGLGFSAAIGVVVAMVFSLAVLPAALVVFGRGLFWPFVPHVGDPPREGRLWGRIGAGVARRPALVATGSIAVLAVLASGAIGLSVGLSEAEQFRTKPESIAAQETLARAFPAGAASPAMIVTDPASVRAVTAAAEQVPGVAAARPGAATETVATVEAVLTANPGTPAADRTVKDLRTAVAAVPGADAVVGGEPATRLDADAAAAGDAAVVIPLVLLIVFVVLVVLLRALVAPVLLVLTVLGTFFASLGASWWLLQNVLGYPGLDSGVLLISFLFLVALGVDYNIFLVTRAKEEAVTLGTKAGMLEALRVTGGVITSAGVLLAAVFVVLGVLPLIALAQIGLIVCLGVLLDTLLVRTVLVPALTFLTGDRFWWPSRRDQSGDRPDLARQSLVQDADLSVPADRRHREVAPGRATQRWD